MSKFEGRCLCGKVEYAIDGDASAFYHCYCQRCRRTNGAEHASNLRVTASGVNWLKGAEQIKSYKVPEADRFRNDFCGNCGSPLPRAVPKLGFVIVPAGSLTSELPNVPSSRIFFGSRADWADQEGLPEYDAYPPQS